MTAKVIGFGHMLMFVRDMDASVAFYTERLGFKIRPAKPLQDGRPFVAFEAGFALVAGGRQGHRQIDHLAFEVDDIRTMRADLKSHETHFQQDLHDGPYGLTIYISDPDDLRIELYQVGLKFDGNVDRA